MVSYKTQTRNWLSFAKTRVHYQFLRWVCVAHLFSFLCLMFNLFCLRSVSCAQCCLRLWTSHSLTVISLFIDDTMYIVLDYASL
jgi:hypothetical protein